MIHAQSLQSCPIFATPYTVAHQAPLSMGFSRQEYWSGLPFPSPGDLPYPGTETRSPALQADSLLAEPQGKPKNTEMGSLSLLHWIFPTKESNQGLLHCREILYQLSYEGSPYQTNSKEIKCFFFQLNYHHCNVQLFIDFSWISLVLITIVPMHLMNQLTMNSIYHPNLSTSNQITSRAMSTLVL